MDKAGMEPTPEGRTGEAIRGAAEGAKEELSRLGEEVKEKSASILHNQRETASRQIHSLANALEVGADTLDEEGQARLAEVTRDAAGRIHRFGDDFMERDFGRTVDNVSRYARENPAVVIGGAAVFGFVLSRFLKSSSDRSPESYGSRTSSRDVGGERAYESAPSTPAQETGATDISYSAGPVTTEPPMDTRTSPYEGMAPGVSPVGESARVEDTRRRFGDGTES